MSVHPHANAFDDAAAEYERGRPGYPHALLDWLRARGQLGETSTVIDLGAGTGKLTRLLVESQARVIAIEPLAAMREQFTRILPETELLDATAESIPFPDDSVDLVTCGQSFRWFATDSALEEIARVLRPGGELVLAFNGDDKTNAVQVQFAEILRIAETEAEEEKPGANWREVLFANPHFELLEETTLPNTHFVDREGVASRVRSSSQFARLPVQRQAQLLADIDALIEGDVIDLPQITRVTLMRKVATG